MRRRLQMTAVLLTACLAGTLGVVMPSGYAQDKLIKIDGSGTVFPATEAVAEEFQTIPKVL